MSFKYQEDEILSDSLTVTNFHTYYQGSEMVVAGKMEDLGINPDELIEYKILATQAMGQQYSILGAYNGSEVISKRGLTFLFCQDAYALGTHWLPATNTAAPHKFQRHVFVNTGNGARPRFRREYFSGNYGTGAGNIIQRRRVDEDIK